MKFLLVVKQKKNIDTFAATIRALLDRGHSVTLTVQEGQELRHDSLPPDGTDGRFVVVRSPASRMDEWAEAAPLLRSLRDCAHYLRPAILDARKLQRRSVKKLREDLALPGEDQALAAALRDIPDSQVGRLDAILELAEQHVPADPLWRAFIEAHAPDVVLLSPVVHFGSAQADIVAAARSLGLPVGMLLFSWDNLSTKGRLHQQPDWMFVWNEQQRHEAAALHGFAPDRVIVTGAPRFDSFFELRTQMTRAGFLEPLGLDPSQPTFLYVCSSAFVSSEELPFIRQWLDAVRRGSVTLRHSNVIVRPHPDIELVARDEAIEELRWPSLRGLRGFVARPFGDPHAVVLRTSDRMMQGLYESIVHSAAVVGLNTSAELEAAIAGTPVYTILADERDADGQSGTIHFHYLVEEHGGFVKVARDLDEHVAMLASEVATPTDPVRLRRFVGDFLRPLGLDRPVSPLLAEAIERTFASVQSGGIHAAREAEGSQAEMPHPGFESHLTEDTPPRPLAFKPRRIQLHAFDDAGAAAEGRKKYRPDPTTVEWLQQHVAVGEVLYDIGAGIGVYTLLAAMHRGSVVVAFEPGYAAFKLLCDNLLLNGCNGSVIPLSVALSDREGMAELKYVPGRPGQHRHTVRRAAWRVKRAASDDRAFIQPVLATTLDDAVERYGLPLPNHVRFGEDTSVTSVLAGAARVMSTDRLKTIFVTVAEDEYGPLTSALDSQTWQVGFHKSISRNRAHVLMCRSDAVAATR